ncbi:conjugal transfer protein TrbI, partial (plasmid) [Xylella fastidiosa subsp. pauca]|nr:conjugal transfer protein TrbI [Xylella fastidiosa subsp. pauca]
MNKTIDFSNAGALHAGWKNRSFWRADQQGEVKNKCRQIPRPWFGAYGVFVHGGRALFYQKYKLAHPSVKTPAKSDSLKPELASNNASLESDLIEKKKAEIKKKQEEEQAQIKAI